MGFEAVDFRCPVCKSNKWGTHAFVGECHGMRHDGKPCDFRWSRRHDYSVFVRPDGRGFRSPLELEQVIGMRTTAVAGGVVRLCGRGGRTAFPELLHDLLGELMARPPTVGVVERWTVDEKRRALDWATQAIMTGSLVGPPPRPPFIEEGAGTA
jgi:hypothetical protein